jgi:lipopolysaccharide transport system ATP-binding protein
MSAIEITGLGKKYILSHQSNGARSNYTALRDVVTDGVASLFRPRDRADQGREEFWALRDVCLSVEPGERVGIIGRNGAGKSTLLKLISRITEPTTGRIELRGRVASLLEVGTGFHPELTGRENIYLNGAILGMSRTEIARNFDAIVAFAEVERFLDTPVKRYSSGMYVRLAFAVAAHLEPEILIVDEVLAVGDLQFQKRCLGKMQEVGSSGRTVLFVSHNMGAIKQLCLTGVLLTQGNAQRYDDVGEMISDYQLAAVEAATGSSTIEVKSKDIVFHSWKINGLPAEMAPEVFSGDPLAISCRYDAGRSPYDLCVSVGIRSINDGVLLVYTHNHLENVRYETERDGSVEVTLPLPKFSPRSYSLEVQIWLDGQLVVNGREVCQFGVLETPTFAGTHSLRAFPSALMTPSQWTFRSGK